MLSSSKLALGFPLEADAKRQDPEVSAQAEVSESPELLTTAWFFT